jgi:hypothetical protein
MGETLMTHAGAKKALIAALSKDDPIGTYEPFVRWLSTHKRGNYKGGPLYLQQALSSLAFALAETGDIKQIQSATDSLLIAERHAASQKEKP